MIIRDKDVSHVLAEDVFNIWNVLSLRGRISENTQYSSTYRTSNQTMGCEN